jgi:hypothetical protein
MTAVKLSTCYKLICALCAIGIIVAALGIYATVPWTIATYNLVDVAIPDVSSDASVTVEAGFRAAFITLDYSINEYGIEEDIQSDKEEFVYSDLLEMCKENGPVSTINVVMELICDAFQVDTVQKCYDAGTTVIILLTVCLILTLAGGCLISCFLTSGSESEKKMLAQAAADVLICVLAITTATTWSSNCVKALPKSQSSSGLAAVYCLIAGACACIAIKVYEILKARQNAHQSTGPDPSYTALNA